MFETLINYNILRYPSSIIVLLFSSFKLYFTISVFTFHFHSELTLQRKQYFSEMQDTAHEQSITCNKKYFVSYAHAQNIIYKQLFSDDVHAGFVANQNRKKKYGIINQLQIYNYCVDI